MSTMTHLTMTDLATQSGTARAFGETRQAFTVIASAFNGCWLPVYAEIKPVSAMNHRFRRLRPSP